MNKNTMNQFIQGFIKVFILLKSLVMIKGDVIIKINGKKLLNIQEYMGRMAELKKGQKIKVTVLRNGDKKVLDVQL